MAGEGVQIKSEKSSMPMRCQKKIGKHGLSIGFLNIRSLSNKVDEVQLMLQEESLDILFLNETWLKCHHNNTSLVIPGYTLYRNDRNDRNGGGVAAYVKETLNITLRHDLSKLNDVEQIWMESNVKLIGDILIGTVYRPPNCGDDYYDAMLDTLDVLSSEGKEIVLVGDLNYNCIDSTHNKVQGLMDMYDMDQIVNSPTRIAFKKDGNNTNLTLTQSLIDIILTTCKQFHRNTCVKEYSLSDHSMVKTQLYVEVVRRHNTITYRNYRKFNPESFINDLKSSDVLNNIHLVQDIDEAWDCFKKEFDKICNIHAPLRTSRLKIRKNPWMDRELLETMYCRDKLYKCAKETKNTDDHIAYKKMRNKVTNMIRNKKRQYFETNLTEANSTTIWKILEQAMPKSKFEKLHTSLTSETFRHHFSTIGENISNTFENYNHSEPTTVKGESIYTFKFTELPIDKIENKLSTLPSHSSLDILNMDSKLLQIAHKQISQPLHHIYNLSLKTETVVGDWKLARVSPVYKGKGPLEEPTSYRPIASVSHLAKILEKLINTQLMDYLTNHHFISPDQAAYQKNNSTQSAVHRIVEDLLEAWNESDNAICCFLDISKCYDTIHHDILIKKLSSYGICNNELKWIQSYLQDRSMKVNFNNDLSELAKINIGLPQGSTLGPTLFLLFVNDLSQAISQGSLSMYADDGAIYVIDKDPGEARKKMQIALDNAAKWYRDNRLQLNADKCYVMYIGGKMTENDANNLYLNGKCIQIVDSVKYLGLILDSKLSFKQHADHVISKGKSKLSCLRKLSKFLPESTLSVIYKSKIEPAIDYLGTVWGHVSESNMSKGQRIQNMAARILKHDYDFINHRGIDLVHDLGWKDFNQRQHYYNAILTYKAIHGLVSQYICNLILFEFETHSHETRGAINMNLAIPLIKKEKFRNSFQYYNANLWNNLPQQLKDTTSLISFKSTYKRLYFKSQPHGTVF